MKTLTDKQLALAKQLMKENDLEKIYAIENGHMYSDPANALHSVGKSSLQEAIEEGLIIVVEAEKKAAADSETQPPSVEEKPSDKWTVDKLKAFATEKKVELGDAKTKAEILAAINKASEAPAA